VNHAILMEDEVESAVRKLLGAELIAVRQRAFFLTEAGEVMKAAKRGGLLGLVDQLLLALRRRPVAVREWNLQPGELRHAANAWNARAEQLMENHRRPPHSQAPG
jgi:hypothetical protein